jgi:protein-disulfide isomerase
MGRFATSPAGCACCLVHFELWISSGAPQCECFGEHAEGRIRQRVQTYLLDHPEVIIESVNRMEARQRASAEAEVQTIVKSHADELFRDADSPVGGNPNGDITLVEFFDYNCPYCRQMVPVMMQAEASDPQLRVVYKEFPILGPNSTFAAKAALAAHKQGKYVAFHRALYQVRGAVDPSKVTEVAVAVGLDADRLKADMGNPTIGALIEKNLALARALRIDGTPGFVAGNQVLRGAVDLKALQGFIQEARGTGDGADEAAAVKR